MLDLTKEEIETLYGILITEKEELKDLIETVSDADKAELQGELKRVDSMINKIKEIR